MGCIGIQKTEITLTSIIFTYLTKTICTTLSWVVTVYTKVSLAIFNWSRYTISGSLIIATDIPLSAYTLIPKVNR